MQRIFLKDKGTDPQGLEFTSFEDRVRIGGYWIARSDWEKAIEHDRNQVKPPKQTRAKDEAAK